MRTGPEFEAWGAFERYADNESVLSLGARRRHSGGSVARKQAVLLVDTMDSQVELEVSCGRDAASVPSGFIALLLCEGGYAGA